MTTPKQDKTPRWYLDRFLNVLHYEGINAFILRIAASVGYKSGIWFVGWYAKPIVDNASKADAQSLIEVDELSLADVDDYVTSEHIITAEQFNKRMSVGDRCYVVRRDSKIVSASWIATDFIWIDFIARDLPLAKDEIYLYDSFTHPSCRGQRIQGKLLAEILSRYQAAGYKQICVIIAPENKANIKSRLHSGFKRTAWIFAINIGKFHWNFFRGRQAK